MGGLLDAMRLVGLDAKRIRGTAALVRLPHE